MFQTEVKCFKNGNGDNPGKRFCKALVTTQENLHQENVSMKCISLQPVKNFQLKKV